MRSNTVQGKVMTYWLIEFLNFSKYVTIAQKDRLTIKISVIYVLSIISHQLLSSGMLELGGYYTDGLLT